ncbi:tetratricopeptide repeat protein [Duganella zoogloeoides]|uniref:Tetratricopeptide repeat protein n=1 Tax=Duganella zoogloeoides TaxID=75659 RepID=A0ABZ0Y3X3_9BURK|nr:tetratricopeptide repeat protein [Duganella zoogloeoides]WQH06720.1 tetratricopeptide repeat protein [Duganella zoogloeoides]
MSLINKMLQDLDARGGAREEDMQQRELKAVPLPERERRPLVYAGAGVAVVVAAIAGWYGWKFAHRPAPGPVPVMAAPPTASPALASTPTPTQAAGPAAVPVGTSPDGSVVTPAATSPATAAVNSTATPAATSTGTAAAASTGTAAGTSNPVTAGAPSTAAPAIPASAAATAAPPSAQAGSAAPARAAATPSATAAATRRAAAADAGTPRQPRQGVAHADGSATTKPELTPKQLSENTYRRGLASLQDGRLNAAMADLDRALEIDPRNDAARQTYVSLLLENRRPDDAIRQLRLALGIDPRQPGLAMVLARLQLERGGPALETLMTTLPYAAANADYQGFLAGVLQRAQRHAEAAQYYQAALKLAPLNGVWWMGLGISLQADQHKAEAREAFTRARTGNGITPELLAFIDRRLDQLSR